MGEQFARLLPDAFSPSRDVFDVTVPSMMDDFLKSHSCDLIIHCAAYTQVDQAEKEPDACHKVNVEGVQNLMKYNIPIIHFSSDYVFDASEDLEIPENHPRSALNIYGQSKINAEKVLERSGIRFWNIRTSWLFGGNHKNFIKTILEASKNRHQLSVIYDQIGRPTYAKDLARYVVDHFVSNPPKVGHYHLQGSGQPVSWADLAAFLLKNTNWQGNIEKIPSKQFPTPAKRPKNSLLLNTKLAINLRDWKDTVSDYQNELTKQEISVS